MRHTTHFFPSLSSLAHSNQVSACLHQNGSRITSINLILLLIKKPIDARVSNIIFLVDTHFCKSSSPC